MKKAFTLIELLVVVLIIGVLSAIALPQYEKAVEKSRMAEALLVAKSMRDALQLYILANGYPESGYLNFMGPNAVGGLDIDFDSFDCNRETPTCHGKYYYYRASCGADPFGVGIAGCYAVAARALDAVNELSFQYSIDEEANTWNKQCMALTGGDNKKIHLARMLCQAAGFSEEETYIDRPFTYPHGN